MIGAAYGPTLTPRLATIRKAEDFFADFLNLVYGYELKNLSHDSLNNVASDLGDSTRRIAVQVTSERTKAKIQTTLDKFDEQGLVPAIRVLPPNLDQSGRNLKPMDKWTCTNPSSTTCCEPEVASAIRLGLRGLDIRQASTQAQSA
jgi:hypothetical protein